jgi:hypothetical protein
VRNRFDILFSETEKTKTYDYKIAFPILLAQTTAQDDERMRISSLVAFLPLFVVHPALWSQTLSCSPCSHGFGKVKVGSSVSFSIQLSNTGSQSLSILSKSKQGSEFHFGSFPLPLTLLPGKTVNLPIVFKPTATGHVSGTFILTSNALDGTLSLPVTGSGAAVITVSPSSLNFGNVTVGNSASLNATLTASDGDVTISSDQLNSSEFSVSGLNPPVTIHSGSSLGVALQFTPNQSGTASGKMQYFSNAIVSPSVELLTGTGVAQNAHSVGLTWQDSGTNVVGYNIYRATVHGGPYQKINTALDASTNYSDSSVSSGKTYYYVTTAVNSNNQESGFSNETQAVVPSP